MKEQSRSEADGCEGRQQKGSGRLRRKTAERKRTAAEEDSRKEADGCEGRQLQGTGQSRKMMEKECDNMRRGKRLAALFLCACMAVTALTGCGGEDKNTDEVNADGVTGKATEGEEGGTSGEGTAGAAKGRFLETELELPENIKNIVGVRKCDDDSIVLIGRDENNIGLYMERSDNGGQDWTETKLDGSDFRSAAINTDGSAVLIGYGGKMEFVSADGTIRQLDVELPSYEGKPDDWTNLVQSAGFAGGKLFIVDLNDGFFAVDTENGELTDYTKTVAESIMGVIPLGEQLALLTRNGVRLMDAAEGTLLAEDEELSNALGVLENNTDTPIYPIMIAAGGSADELYYVSHEGIFYHKQGGSTSEQLANGELISVGDGSLSFRELARFDDEHFVVFAVDSLGTEHCYSYTYDANASAVPEKQLKVYALEDSVVLQQVVSMFQKQNQDVFVKKTIGMSGDDSMTAEDAIKTLNTEIMAGNGPDVLVLDGLPVDSYVEKGILSDISSFVADVDKAEGLFTNITDACKKDGVIYEVPLRFYCMFAEKDEGIGTLCGSPGQLAAAVQSAADQGTPVFAPLPAEMFLYTLYDVYSASWKTDGGIDAEGLKSCLEAAKTIYDLDGYEEKDRISYSSMIDLYQGQALYGTIGSGSSSRVMGKARISIGTVDGTRDVCDLYGVESARAGSFELLCGEGQKSFLPLVCLGLAESAKDNGMAQDFISLALSMDAQKQMTHGFSINRKAYEDVCENMEEYSIGGSDQDGTQFGYEVKKLDASQRDALTAMLESLEVPIWNDRVVMELVVNEGTGYLRGEKSLEDTVGAITQKVLLYVSE